MSSQQRVNLSLLLVGRLMLTCNYMAERLGHFLAGLGRRLGGRGIQALADMIGGRWRLRSGIRPCC